MVVDVLSLVVGIAGFGWAGWKDLKTTEFPDWLPYSLIIFALVARGGFGLVTGNFAPFISSVTIGVLFLAFGLALYYSKQWGDGDGWLLGAMGFLFPDGIGVATSFLPFPALLLFNFFFVAFFYVVVYSIIVGMRSREGKTFFKGFRSQLARIVGITALFTALLAGVVWYLAPQVWFLLLAFPPFLFLLLAFMHYGRFIEQTVFRRKIPVSKLREGDVPADEKWRVLSKKEIDRLKKRGGTIWIKEGVRFAPVFVLTVLVMLIYGNLLTAFGL